MLWLWLGIPNNSQDFVFKSVYPNQNFEYDVATSTCTGGPKVATSFESQRIEGNSQIHGPFRFQVEKRPKIHPVFWLKCPWNGKFLLHHLSAYFSTNVDLLWDSSYFLIHPLQAQFFGCELMSWCECTEVIFDFVVIGSNAGIFRMCADFPHGKSNATSSTCTYASFSRILDDFKQSICNFSNKLISSDKKVYISEFCQL